MQSPAALLQSCAISVCGVEEEYSQDTCTEGEARMTTTQPHEEGRARARSPQAPMMTHTTVAASR